MRKGKPLGEVCLGEALDPEHGMVNIARRDCFRCLTWYQLLLATLEAGEPLRKPSARGRPTATTELRGMARRILGIWKDIASGCDVACCFLEEMVMSL